MSEQEISSTSSPEEHSQPQPTEPQRQRIMQRMRHAEYLLAQAMKDEAWRQQLLSDPKPLLERELGMQIPPGVSIQVHEDTSTTMHLVLPPRLLPAGEVSEADLEATPASRAAYTDSVECGVSFGYMGSSTCWYKCGE